MYFIKKGGVDMLKREDIIAMAKDAKAYSSPISLA